MATVRPRSFPSKTKLKPIASKETNSKTNGTRQTTDSRNSSSAPTSTFSNRGRQTAGRRVGSGGPTTARTRPSSRKLAGGEHDETEPTSDGQDIRFIDVSSGSGTPGPPAVKGQTLTPQEILTMSQESSYDSVYEVNLHTSNLSTVPRLDKFPNLRLLDLSCNFIKQIENLQQSKSLKELKLYGNEIGTVSNLDSLAELHTLQLQHNRIQSIGPSLSGLRKLKVLRLDSNRLRKLDSREIAPCSQISTLDISGNRMDSLNSLNCLSSMEELHATHNGLTAVTDLSRCKKLNEVNLSYNKLSDVSGLKGLPHLTILHLSHNSLTTSCLKALGKLRSLQNLDVSHNQLTDASLIPDLFPSVEVLNVTANRLQKWKAVCTLKKCTSLSELYISGNPFCSEDGEKPSYHQDLQRLMPDLDILDGVHVKKTSAKTAPVMRPMSAASALSARQVENQLRGVEEDMASFGASLSARFESLRCTMERLPSEPPSPRPGTALSLRSVSTSDGSRPGSRCNSRSRILEAQVFATQHF